MVQRIFLCAVCYVFAVRAGAEALGPKPGHDMRFGQLASRWDEAVPLGNGMVGALVWAEGDVLRFSLDRADLWDLRPVPNYEKPECAFDWMHERVLAGDIESVHELIDRPYDNDPAPTKIPAGRLEFPMEGLGAVTSVHLRIENALCRVEWDSGAVLETFVHAMEPIGWFRFEGLPESIWPTIDPPPFQGGPSDGDVNSLSGHQLSALGYPAPAVEGGGDWILYEQEGWGGFLFAIACRWRAEGDTLTGVWTVRSNHNGGDPGEDAQSGAKAALERSFEGDFREHADWWRAYWDQSTLDLPDEVIEKQWYLEQYKFGSASRRGAPPITLQAVWTADERRVPPWKGDYHHDLNTQLSYWPCYAGNRLEEGLAFLDWLWDLRPYHLEWTKRFYGHGGLNVPGTTTLDGAPMGGWSQYSFSPTTSAWLAHHFYLHWKYSADEAFLRERGYPYLRDVAEFLELHGVKDGEGRRGLPLSSSPEIHNNSLEAWFRVTTNYDLALVRWLYGAAAEMADALGKDGEASRWRSILREWPGLALSDEDGRLLVAPGEALEESHRHFSHLMAIHPLGIIDWENGETDRRTIMAALDELDRLGPDWWCGYSYAWLGNLCARAREGEKAAEALRTFAQCFVSVNSFHLNGDQSKSGKSKMQYRPFTLEGNFAYAAGVQEMLIQSHAGAVRLFPAIPSD